METRRNGVEKEERSLESKPSDSSAGWFLEIKKYQEPPKKEKRRWVFSTYLPGHELIEKEKI